MLKKSFALLFVVGSVVLAAGVAVAQIQTKDQQKCINKVNKDAIKIQAAQGKINSSCIKDFVKGKVAGPGAAETCIQSDPKSKVSKKQGKLVADEGKFCGTAPDFAYVGSPTATDAPVDAERNLAHSIYGNPLDSGMFICDTFPNECFCQRTTTKRINKIFRAASKIFIKCKKAALKVGKDPFDLGADNLGDIEACVTDGVLAGGLSVESDTKGKISKATSQLGDTIGQFCGLGGSDEFGGGDCAALSGTALRDCIANETLCHFCEMINDVDGLAIDCATWSGAICP